MAPPINRKYVRRFFGMIDYYRDIWYKRSHMLQVLTKLTSVFVKFEWISVEQEMFDEIK